MAGSDGIGAFTPALLVVDMQEDFCPPVSRLTVPEVSSCGCSQISGRLVGSSWWA